LQDFRDFLHALSKHLHVLLNERHFSRRALEMGGKDIGILGIDHRVFNRTLEQVVGVAHEVLIERIFKRNEHHQRFIAAPSGTARTLPRARDGPRESDQHGGVEAADVDTCLILGAGYPFWLGGITKHLDQTGVSQRVAGRPLADVLEARGRTHDAAAAREHAANILEAKGFRAALDHLPPA